LDAEQFTTNSKDFCALLAYGCRSPRPSRNPLLPPSNHLPLAQQSFRTTAKHHPKRNPWHSTPRRQSQDSLAEPARKAKAKKTMRQKSKVYTEDDLKA